MSLSILLEVLTPQGRFLGEGLSFLPFSLFLFSFFSFLSLSLSFFSFHRVFLAPNFIKKMFKTSAWSSRIKRQRKARKKYNNKNKIFELSPFPEEGWGPTISRDRIVYQASKDKELLWVYWLLLAHVLLLISFISVLHWVLRMVTLARSLGRYCNKNYVWSLVTPPIIKVSQPSVF